MDDYNSDLQSLWATIPEDAILSGPSWLTNDNRDPFISSTWNDEEDYSCPSKRARRSTEESFTSSVLSPPFTPQNQDLDFVHLNRNNSNGINKEDSILFPLDTEDLMNEILKDINKTSLTNKNEGNQSVDLPVLSPPTFSLESHHLPFDESLLSNDDDSLDQFNNLQPLYNTSTSDEHISSTSNDVNEPQTNNESLESLFNSLTAESTPESTQVPSTPTFMVEVLPTQEISNVSETSIRDNEPMVIINFDPQRPSVVQATFDLSDALQYPIASSSSSDPLPSPITSPKVSSSYTPPPMNELFVSTIDGKGQERYSCLSCRDVLRNYKEATKHFRNKHAIYECQYCPSSHFIGYFRMNAHTKKMHKKPTTVSCQCGRGFSSEKGLNKHKLNCPAYQEHMTKLRSTLKPTYQFLS
ncbi:uncharacterized protein [Lepeophtheirus salmonis]|uniref:uncharacterized protein n=1 Tax=Lepeophtheirus salmonis TaxID=72036 RepID=UPI001AE50BAE|nr:uncharacterized protein LOC121125733 [Lepeophtheirus salmonis]